MADDSHDSAPERDVNQIDAFDGIAVPLGVRPPHPNDPPKTNGHDVTRINGHDIPRKPRAEKTPPDAPFVVNPQAPLDTARLFVELKHTDDDLRTLLHHQASFMGWTGTHYTELPQEQARAQLYDFLESTLIEAKGGALVPFRPTTRKVNDVLDAARAVTQLHGTIATPAWLDDPPFPARDVLACANGLLHLPSGKRIDHTPNFYCVSCLDYAHAPGAPPPKHWLGFLLSVWPDDQESRDTLQEIFGYLIGNDSDQQKIPLIIGPKRSGKGTIGRTLTALLGQDSVVSPILSALAGAFGSEPLIGKKLAIIADARLSGHIDAQVIAERLLSISGEDSQTVDRKHKPAWSGRLPTRFLMMSNELPQIGDASGALAGRYIVLNMTESFYGKEDRGLGDRILTELPSILNWAIEGWKRLRARGRFVQPSSAQELIRDLEELTSPVSGFIRERCDVAAGKRVTPDALFQEWRNWCVDQNRDRPGTKAQFGKSLRTALPWLRATQERDGDDRSRAYNGLGLKTEFVHKQAAHAEGLDLDT